MAAQKSTLPPESKEEQDKLYNPGDIDARERFGDGYVSSGTDQLEAFANDPNNASEKVDQAEQDIGAGGEKDGLYRKTDQKSPNQKKKKFKSFFQRKSTVGGLIALLLGGVGAFSVVLTPGLGIFHMREVMFNDLNDQLAAFDVSSGSMWRTKLKGLQAGASVCSDLVKIRCQYRTMSEKTANNFVKEFDKEGYKVTIEEVSEKRYRVTQVVTPDNVTLSDPQDLMNRTGELGVRKALTRIHSPVFASFSDGVANKVLKTRFFTSKAEKLTGTTKEELDDSLRRNTTGDLPEQKRAVLIDSEGREYIIGPDGEPLYKGEDGYDEALRKLNESGDAFDKRVSDTAASGVKATSSLLLGAAKGVSVLGAVDSACTIYNLSRAVEAAAKAARAIQLAQFAMTFHTTSDQIRAGDGTAEQASYLGDMITAVDTREMIVDEQSAVTGGSKLEDGFDNAEARPNPDYGKSGFDSAGFKAAAYNESSVLSARSQQYMTGGGLTGTLAGVNDTITGMLGNNPDAVRTTCNVVQNVWVRVIGLTIGVIAAIGSFGTLTAISIGASLALSMAAPFLEAMLTDIVAGQVIGPSTVGVEAGDAIFSGTGALLGGVANARGMKPASTEDLETYLARNNTVKNEYEMIARDEAKSTPLDVNNQYSFLGSLARSVVVPLTDASTSTSATIASIPKILQTSFSSIIPSASATSVYNPDRFNKCSDSGYEALNIDADIFCNVRYVFTEDDFAKYEEGGAITATEKTLDFMLDKKYIDNDGLPVAGSLYEKFVQYCTERPNGWGETGEEQSTDWTTGKNCMGTGPDIKESTLSYFRAYTMDSSVSYAINGELPPEKGDPTTVVDSGTVVSPVSPAGYVTSYFGPRSCNGCSTWHQGTDFVSPDQKIFAIMDGVVTLAGGGFNNIVVVRHADGLQSTYWHMYDSGIMVSVGDTVAAGQQIGVMGNQGQSQGTHLHMELDIGEVDDRAYYTSTYEVNSGGYNPGLRINPLDFLTKNGVTGF